MNKPSLIHKVLGTALVCAFIVFILACISVITAQAVFFLVSTVIAIFSLLGLYMLMRDLGLKRAVADIMNGMEVNSPQMFYYKNSTFVLIRAKYGNSPIRYVVNGTHFNCIDDVGNYILEHTK